MEESYVVWKRWSTFFEALKMWHGQSGYFAFQSADEDVKNCTSVSTWLDISRFNCIKTCRSTIVVQTGWSIGRVFRTLVCEILCSWECETFKMLNIPSGKKYERFYYVLVRVNQLVCTACIYSITDLSIRRQISTEQFSGSAMGDFNASCWETV